MSRPQPLGQATKLARAKPILESSISALSIAVDTSVTALKPTKKRTAPVENQGGRRNRKVIPVEEEEEVEEVEEVEDAPKPVAAPKKIRARARVSRRNIIVESDDDCAEPTVKTVTVVTRPSRAMRRQNSGMTDSSGGASTVGSMGLSGLMRQSSDLSL